MVLSRIRQINICTGHKILFRLSLFLSFTLLYPDIFLLLSLVTPSTTFICVVLSHFPTLLLLLAYYTFPHICVFPSNNNHYIIDSTVYIVTLFSFPHACLSVTGVVSKLPYIFILSKCIKDLLKEWLPLLHSFMLNTSL